MHNSTSLFLQLRFDYSYDWFYFSDDDSDTEISNDLFGYKKRVFEFLNTAKNLELQQLQGCSSKKAEVIASLRPFSGWIDVVSF